jgi:hypothetical protein
MDSWLQVKPDVVCVGFGKKPSYPCFRSPNTVETADMTRDDFKLLADALKANPRFNASWFLTAAGFYR